jgi:putative spermidine/putrescine transport system permease protein
MGVVVKNYAFVLVLGRNGVLSQVLEFMHLTSGPTSFLYSNGAVIQGMTYAMLPYATLPLYVTLSTIDRDLVRMAESLGATHRQAISSVVIRLATPGVVAAGTVVFVVALGFYVTPLILGGTTQFTAAIVYDNIFQFYDVPSAAIASLILLTIGLAALLVGAALVGRQSIVRSMGGGA